MKRILNVNDQPALRKMASRILSEAGYDILEAADGEEALRYVRESRPDLILLDIRMPGMSGFEVCRRVKGDPATEDIPVVVMSGHHVSEDDQIHGLKVGADAYLTLPLDKANLIATISRF